ncbi:MAG: hypothetical protein ABI555_06235, partial [Chloroflexota bacterium]
MAGREVQVPGRETVGRRVYRAMLGLYPTPFRRRYGDEMLQLLSDQLRDAGRPGARPGTVGTWFRSLGDLWISAMSERVRGDRGAGHSLGEPPSAAMKALGLVGILGGGLLVAAFIPNLPWTADLFNLRLVMFNLGAIAVAAALFRDQLRASRPLAIAGTVPVVLANVIYLLMVLNLVALPGQPGPGDYGPYWAVGATFLWLSDAWFGVVLFRTRVVARWLALTLAIAATI